MFKDRPFIYRRRLNIMLITIKGRRKIDKGNLETIFLYIIISIRFETKQETSHINFILIWYVTLLEFVVYS